MHGYIIVLLEDFVKDYYAYAYSPTFGLAAHDAKTLYPDEVFTGYIQELSKYTMLSPEATLERFGTYCGTTLMARYKDRMPADITLFDALKMVEDKFHSIFIKEGASPPTLHPFMLTPGWMVIDYQSPRRMAEFGIGIIKGMAEYMREPVDITCTTSRDGERVEIHVTKKD